jgi:hypothetical protein
MEGKHLMIKIFIEEDPRLCVLATLVPELVMFTMQSNMTRRVLSQQTNIA